MEKKIHKIVSIAFQENFPTSQMPSDWQLGNIITDSKDTKAKSAIGGGVIFAYSFGALTFVDVEASERTYEMGELRTRLGLKMDAKVTTEEFTVEEDATEPKQRVEHSKIVLDKFTPERMAVIAQVIAQSAAMEFYESITSTTKSKVNELMELLSETGSVGKSPQDIYRQIGYAMSVRNEVISMLHLLDKPDLIWEDYTMDKLYPDLRAAFDLSERFKALEYKLTLIHDNLELLAEIAKDSRIFRVDLAIVGLIVFEVFWELFKHFYLGG